MIRRNKKDENYENYETPPNHTHNNLITGMFIGFIMYIAFDMYRDDKRRKQLFKDIEGFKKELKPYVANLKDYLENSSEFKQAVLAVDESLGTGLYSFISDSETDPKGSNDSRKESNSKRSTTSIKRFFKIK